MQEKILLQSILVNLLKGIIYQEHDSQLWNSLIMQKATVVEYFKMIGLELFLDEVEGYAFLRQIVYDDVSDVDPLIKEIPQLIARRQLNYTTSLLCVLLRKKMLEYEVSGGTRVILNKEEIINMMGIYFPKNTNEAKIADNIETCINRLVDFGFLRKLKGNDNSYEVGRIIKAFIDADWLSNLDEKIKEYQKYGNDNR